LGHADDRRRAGRRRLSGLLLCLAALSCSRLPDYAAPRGEMARMGTTDFTDSIGYRTVEKADFKGSAPPPDYGANGYKLGAITCASIVMRPEPQIMTRWVRKDGETQWFAELKEPPRYLAVMRRRCSWWNPKTEFHDYQLQHEQIHFAHTEIAARKLNALAAEIDKAARVSGSSQKEVAADCEEALVAPFKENVEALLARGLKFDEQTSGLHAVDVQKRWFDAAMKELEELSAYEHGGDAAELLAR
jgi:hypothetical protein